MKVDLESLPHHIQEQIRESQKEPEPLYPIAPRQFTNTHMQTKEFIELTEKVDQIIEVLNNKLWQ